MKTLLSLTLLAFALTTQAQTTTTNLDFRVQVETVTSGVTNKVSTSWRWDYGNKKEAQKVDGWLFAHGVYAASLPTNQTAVAIGPYIKQQVFALTENYAQQKQASDNAVLLQKLASLLTINSDLLSNADLNNLNAIADKAP